MLLYFLDTSALTKRYFLETGWEFIDALFLKSDARLLISSLTRVELVSAFARKAQNKQLKPEAVIAISDHLAYDIAAARLGVLRIDTEHFYIAQKLVMKWGIQGLRTLDALQLSTLCAMKKRGVDITLISSDNVLNQVATQNDMMVIDPQKAV